MNILILDEFCFDGGIKTIQTNIIPIFCTKFKFVFWVLPSDKALYFDKKFKNIPNLTILQINYPKYYSIFLNKNYFGNKFYELIRSLYLRRIISHYSIDFLFTSCIFLQNFPNVKIPSFGIFCDLNQDNDLRKQVARSLLTWLKKSSCIFSISEYTKKSVLDIFPSYSHKMETVPLAACTNEKIEFFKQRDKHIFFYPSNAISNKNHLCLFKAIKLLSRRTENFKVVLSGKNTDKFGEMNFFLDGQMSLTNKYYMYNKSTLSKFIKFAGYVSDAEINKLYSICSTVILTSKSEGYGLPFAEAVSFGKPVVCSNIEPFKEQVKFYKYESMASLFCSNHPFDLSNKMLATIEGKKSSVEQQSNHGTIRSTWTWHDVVETYVSKMISSF